MLVRAGLLTPLDRIGDLEQDVEQLSQQLEEEAALGSTVVHKHTTTTHDTSEVRVDNAWQGLTSPDKA